MAKIFGNMFPNLSTDADPVIDVEYRDEREGLLGTMVSFDSAAMQHAVGDFDFPPVPKIIVCAQMPTPEQVDNQDPGTIEFSDEGVVLHLPISDRFTYSDKAISRINRNLIHMLRMSAVVLEFQHILSPQVGTKVVELSLPVLLAEAHAQSKFYCADHEELPIKAEAE